MRWWFIIRERSKWNLANTIVAEFIDGKRGSSPNWHSFVLSLFRMRGHAGELVAQEGHAAGDLRL